MKSHQYGFLKKNKDSSSEHACMEVGKPMRPQPQAKSYRQLQNIESWKNTLSRETAHQLALQYHTALKTYIYEKTLYGPGTMYLCI